MKKPENNKDNKKNSFSKLKNMTKDNKHILIAAGVILGCMLIAFGVWQFYYHGESPDYIATQKQINKVNKDDKKRFNKIHQDSFPTVQEAHDYLVQATGHKDLTSSAISYKTINNDLTNKYGNTAAKALINGLCLSDSMTPNQEINQEVGLSLLDPSQKDYVGFMENRYTTSIYTPNKFSEKSNFSVIDSTILTSNNKLNWQSDNGYYISNPIILPSSVKDNGNNKYSTLLLFIQVPYNGGTDTSVSNFKKEMNSIKVKVNDDELSLSGSHKETNTGDNQIGLQACSSSGAANKLNIWDAKNIKASSIVPVTFDFPNKIIKDANNIQDINISVNNNVIPSLKIYNGQTKIYF